MHLSSNTGEIEVFLLPDDSESENSKSQFKCEPSEVKSEPKSEASTSGTQFGGALLSEADDFGPMGGGKFQLQTEDQNPSTSGEIPAQLRHASFNLFHIINDFIPLL